MTKRSIQRELIKENLLSRCDHPTADMVYYSIRKQLPNISLGTVYRNLRLLVEQGEVLSLKLGDGPEHFDGHTDMHYHFICSCCNEVEDIFMDELPIIDMVTSHCSGQITGHSTYFYGLCKNCSEKH